MPGAALAWLAVLAAAAPPTTVGARIAAAAVAAQNLQGPLDGTWTLSDAAGRPLYVFQIVDPANGAEPVQAAWRSARGGGDLGTVDQIARQSGRLILRFGDHGVVTIVDLRRAGEAWRGHLFQGGRDMAVVLHPG